MKPDVDTLATVPDAPPEAGPDRALEPPPPAAAAEGDVIVAEDVPQAAENPITAHISTADTNHRRGVPAPLASPTTRGHDITNQRVAAVHLKFLCTACDGTVFPTVASAFAALALQPYWLRLARALRTIHMTANATPMTIATTTATANTSATLPRIRTDIAYEAYVEPWRLIAAANSSSSTGLTRYSLAPRSSATAREAGSVAPVTTIGRAARRTLS